MVWEALYGTMIDIVSIFLNICVALSGTSVIFFLIQRAWVTTRYPYGDPRRNDFDLTKW